MAVVTQIKGLSHSLPSAISIKLMKFKKILLGSCHTQTEKKTNSFFLNFFFDEWLLYSSCWISHSKFGRDTTFRTQSKTRQDVNTFREHKNVRAMARPSQSVSQQVSGGYQMLITVLPERPQKRKAAPCPPGLITQPE